MHKETAAFADPNIPFEGDVLLLEIVLSFNINLLRTKRLWLLKRSNEGWVQMHLDVSILKHILAAESKLHRLLLLQNQTAPGSRGRKNTFLPF